MAVQSLRGTVKRTDITVLQSYRDLLSTRPSALSETECFIKLTTINKALAALSDDLFWSPQEIQNKFPATVNSATWTAENAKYVCDIAEEEAKENEPPA